MLALIKSVKGIGQTFVIGATYRSNTIGPTSRRACCFDREIEIGVPDKDGRFETLRIPTKFKTRGKY